MNRTRRFATPSRRVHGNQHCDRSEDLHAVASLAWVLSSAIRNMQGNSFHRR
jgi:hypothetical protein